MSVPILTDITQDVSLNIPGPRDARRRPSL